MEITGIHGHAKILSGEKKNKPKHLTDTQDRPKKELPNLDNIGGYLAVLVTITLVTC